MMTIVMGSFGERLQREREMRGITLEQMSEATKITSRCLRALEEEEFDKLPGGIFNKGFVRAYAHHVGIDEDQAVADFIAASGGEKDQPLPDPPEPRAVVLGQQRAEGELNWRAFALLAVLLATAGTAIWKLGPSAVHKLYGALTARSDRAPVSASVGPQSAPDTAFPASPSVAQKAPAAPTPAPDPVPQGAPAVPPPTSSLSAQSAPEVAVPAPSPPPVAEKKSRAKAKAKAVEVAAVRRQAASPAPASAAAPSQTASRSFVVQVRATEDAWVQIVADGKLFSEGVLVPPAEKRVRAAKAVIIKTGNAAGVEVSFNGQPLPPLGEENQMATVTLTAAGVQR